MTLTKFKILINKSNFFWKQIEDLSNIGIDMYNSVFPDIFSTIEKELWVEVYGNEGWETIEWFVYEKLGHSNPDEIKMFDENGNEICKDIPSLFEYLEKNCKNNLVV